MRLSQNLVRRGGFLAACIGLFLFAGGAPQLQAQDAASNGKTIIILDASGSMWGDVKGGVKIDIAKKAIRDLLPTIEDGVEIGLMAYGHRKKGDCSDIELLVPPAAGNRAAILKAVDGIVPKGKTPLCDAVLIAAASLQFEENKASVILISDGIETCDKDPCVVGEQLEAKGIDFVCHVVAFDITRDKNAGLDCLANKTGGLYLEARDAASLKDALNQVVKATVKKPVMEKKTYLLLRGKDGEGKLLPKGVKFAIYKGDEVKGEPMYQGGGGEFKTELAAGEYTVTGEFGKMKAESTLQIPEGKTGIHEMVFKALGLTLHAVMAEGDKPIQKGMAWSIYRAEDGTEGKSLEDSYKAEPVFNLEAGKYIVRARFEESRVEKVVEIEEGTGRELTLILGSGVLVAQAKMSEGSDLLSKGLSWSLVNAEPNSEGEFPELVHSYESKTNLVVAAGKYLLKVRYGESNTQKEVEVKAGEKTAVVLTFGAGTVVAKAVFVEGGEVLEKGLSWSLQSPLNSEGERREVAHSYSAITEFKVPSGTYLLKLKRGEAVAEKEVEVASGEKTELTLSLNAGIWKGQALMAEGAAEAVTKDTSWTVYKPDGEGGRKQVAHAYSKGEFVLPAGTYSLLLKRGAATVEKEISVSAGKVNSDQLVLNAGVVALEGEGKKAAKIEVFLVGEGERKSIVQSYGNKQKYYLPAGAYEAKFTRTVGDEKKASEAKFTVQAGKFLKVELK